MAVSNIRTIFKGLFHGHSTTSGSVPPAISKADWDQAAKKYVHFLKPIADAAAGATYEWPIFCNTGSSTLTITAAKIVPFAALTAHDTDYKTVSLNRRLDAGAAVVAATLTTKITGGTGDWVALTPITWTLSGTAANLVVAAGETLSLHLVHSGSGVAVPVMSCTIEYLETS